MLFGKRRAYQRKAAVAEFDGVCSGDILVFEAMSDRLLPELLPFIVQSDGFFAHALGTSAGSLSPRTKWRDLANYEFALPPLDEQRRIAEILWAADAERRALQGVLESQRSVIAAVGREAFESGDVPHLSLGKLVSDGTLRFQTGPFGTVLKASSYVPSGIPIINPINMVDGKLVTHDGPFLSDEECARLSKYTIEYGDIILARKGDIGRAVFADIDYAGYILGSDCINVRVFAESLDSRYLYYFLTSPGTRAWLARNAAGTTMPGINEKSLAQLSIAIPDKNKQAHVVRVFRQLEIAIDSAKAHLEQSSRVLKVSINRLLGTGMTGFACYDDERD